MGKLLGGGGVDKGAMARQEKLAQDQEARLKQQEADAKAKEEERKRREEAARRARAGGGGSLLSGLETGVTPTNRDTLG